MNTDKSVVKKTETAIDDFFDLWKRRKVVCIFVIIIIILPVCWVFLKQFVIIKDKNDQINNLIDSNAGLQSALKELQKVWEIKEETLLKKEFLYTRTNEFPISSDYFLPGELNIDSLTSYNSPNILNVDNLISSFPPYFHYSNEIKEEEFQDPVTGAMLKVTEIKSDNTANIALYFPSLLEPKIDYIKNVSSGKSWEFNYLGKKYEITILDINSTKSSFRVSIQELTSSDIEDVLDLILINK